VQSGYVPASEDWSIALGQQVLTVRFVYAPDQAPAVLDALSEGAAEPTPSSAVPTLSAPSGSVVVERDGSLALSQGGSRRLWITLGIVIFVAVVAAAAFLALQASGALTPHHTITGTFDLIDSSLDFPSIDVVGGTCEGKGGYSDIAPGASVSLKDGDGKLLGSSSLGTGTGSTTRCTFTYTFSNVPEVPFYTVSVSRRGDVTNSLADMQARGWTFGLTLGK
jgi:hypothetical protein